MDACLLLLLLLFLLFSYILATLHGIWDFSFPTRDGTHTSCLSSMES